MPVPSSPTLAGGSRTARAGGTLLLALLLGLGGCAQMEQAQRDRLKVDAASMRTSGPPKDVREVVQGALRRHLSRPDSFVDGLIGPPMRGSQNMVLVRNGQVVESTRRTTAVGWVVCTRYGARSLFGSEFRESTAVLISAQGEVTAIEPNAAQCVRMPAEMMEPLTL
ncbi:hypothetical protein [Falsiroseomonas sp.]|uniref:hypothetical protein n=1 Tax=Falsiroseomonas sp. TaxID=2870721 RepID=UPI003F6F2BA1